MNKIYYCIECGKKIITPLSTNVTFYCESCRKKKKAQAVIIQNEKRKKLSKLGIGRRRNKKPVYPSVNPQFVRKTDCINYLARCMQPPSGRLLKDPKACTFCRHYKKQTLNDKMEEYNSFRSCRDHGYKSGLEECRS